jgi:hypothetical protein
MGGHGPLSPLLLSNDGIEDSPGAGPRGGCACHASKDAHTLSVWLRRNAAEQRSTRVNQCAGFFEDLSDREDLPTLGVDSMAPNAAEVFSWILAPSLLPPTAS